MINEELKFCETTKKILLPKAKWWNQIWNQTIAWRSKRYFWSYLHEMKKVDETFDNSKAVEKELVQIIVREQADSGNQHWKNHCDNNQENVWI